VEAALVAEGEEGGGVQLDGAAVHDAGGPPQKTKQARARAVPTQAVVDCGDYCMASRGLPAGKNDLGEAGKRGWKRGKRRHEQNK
jgi:hypothetical protein